jgi:hypothetical protein
MDKKIDKKIVGATDEATAYIQMYQSGYLDGFKKGKINLKKDEMIWARIREDCKKAFEKRFKTIFKKDGL